MPTEPIYTQGVSKKPLVSFIIPVYNLPASLVTECLDSILMLSLDAKNCEIIVVDDGSDTSLLSALNAYLDKIVYIRQPNQGAASARNMGLCVAKGEYIQFVDGDDALIPFVYEHCLDLVRCQDAEMVKFDLTRNKKQDNNYNIEGPMAGSQYMSTHNLKVAVWSMLFKRDLLCGLRFTPGLLNEDEEFTPLLILRTERLYITDAKAYYYRKRDNSCTTSKNKKTQLQRLQDTLRILGQFQQRIDTLPPMERNAMQRRIAQLSMDYIYNVARYTHSLHRLETALQEMRRHGLYPLPDKKYTRKYSLFRRLIRTKAGRYLLILMTLR